MRYVSNILWMIVGSKEILGVKFKDGMCPKLCLKLSFERDWYFRDNTENKVPKKSIEELWTVFSNQMIKHQLPHTRFDQISDHKHVIYLYGKLSTKLFSFLRFLFSYVWFQRWLSGKILEKHFSGLKSNCAESSYRTLDSYF